MRPSTIRSTSTSAYLWGLASICCMTSSVGVERARRDVIVQERARGHLRQHLTYELTPRPTTSSVTVGGRLSPASARPATPGFVLMHDTHPPTSFPSVHSKEQLKRGRAASAREHGRRPSTRFPSVERGSLSDSQRQTAFRGIAARTV